METHIFQLVHPECDEIIRAKRKIRCTFPARTHPMGAHIARVSLSAIVDGGWHLLVAVRAENMAEQNYISQNILQNVMYDDAGRR